MSFTAAGIQHGGSRPLFTAAAVDELIRDLALVEPGLNGVNPYGYGGAPGGAEENALRRANLRRYLLDMAERRPAVMVVAEAAGYRGCRLTGIPFLSPALLARGIAGPDGRPFLAESAGYHLPGTGREVGEQSATIVWETLGRAGQLPLLWNIYPLHPHRPGEPHSNRRPTAAEIAAGSPFASRLIAMFAIERIAAVGRVAAAALRRAGEDGRPLAELRHPAHGGKRAFAVGLLRVLNGEAPPTGSTGP